MTAAGFGLPLVVASIFTLGCILIQTAERRADAITEGLGVLFLLCALLNVVAVLAVFAGTRAPAGLLIRPLSPG